MKIAENYPIPILDYVNIQLVISIFSIGNCSQKPSLIFINLTKFMTLLKQLAFAFAITFSMASFTPVIAAGKIENATSAQVKEAANNAFEGTKAALAAIKSGASEEIVLQHLNDVAQESKKIEVGTILDPKRSKAVANIKVARKAVQDKDNATAEDALAKSIELYQEIVNKL